MSRRLTVLALVAALLTSVPEPAHAQGRPVRFEGRVQWVSGSTMSVQLDSGANVNVDLAGVPHEQYFALSAYERVLITGFIPDGSRRVTGTSIQRDPAQSP